MSRKGKEFLIPRNVRKEYGIIGDITLKNLLTKIIPAAVAGFVIVLLPPHGLLPIFIKLSIFCLFMTGIIAITVVRPIKERPNITFKDHLKIKSKYDKMQKLYFLQGKNRQGENEII